MLQNKIHTIILLIKCVVAKGKISANSNSVDCVVETVVQPSQLCVVGVFRQSILEHRHKHVRQVSADGIHVCIRAEGGKYNKTCDTK